MRVVEVSRDAMVVNTWAQGGLTHRGGYKSSGGAGSQAHKGGSSDILSLPLLRAPGRAVCTVFRLIRAVRHPALLRRWDPHAVVPEVIHLHPQELLT